MLNYKKINEVLNRFPLCSSALIAQKGMAVEYCAMGAIAKSLGVSDEELKHHDPMGVSLFNELQPRLLANYGIETLNQFQNLMRTNDSARNSATRNDEVRQTAALMSIDEIERMVRESKADDASARTESGEFRS